MTARAYTDVELGTVTLATKTTARERKRTLVGYAYKEMTSKQARKLAAQLTQAADDLDEWNRSVDAYYDRITQEGFL